MRPNKVRLDRGQGAGPGLMITPLLDIMFLITIFFVLTSSYSQLPALDVSLPEAQTGKPAVSRQITVTLEYGGGIKVDGREVTIHSLAGALQQAAGEGPPPAVLLQGDEAVDYGVLIMVMDRMRSLGWEEISLATRRPGGDP